MEDALIVDEDIAALHIVHAAADADVPAPLAYKLKFQIVFVPVKCGRHERLFPVVVADVDEAQSRASPKTGGGVGFFAIL